MSKISYDTPQTWVKVKPEDYAKFNIFTNIPEILFFNAYVFLSDRENPGIVKFNQLIAKEYTFNDIEKQVEELKGVTVDEFNEAFNEYSDSLNINDIKLFPVEKMIIDNKRCIFLTNINHNQDGRDGIVVNVYFEFNKSIFNFNANIYVDTKKHSFKDAFKKSKILDEIVEVIKSVKIID